MRFIPTRIHGILDYLMGALLIALPWLLGFAAGGAATWVPVVLGAALIVYSLLTDYELGVVKVIGMTAHLWLDAIGGLFLGLAPWIFGFEELGPPAEAFWLLGFIEIAAALLTRTAPSYRAAGGSA
ncbi:MAG TPA: SPW repeat protein [Longimicrobiales bacterium]